jgi:hypothetical protein
MFPDKYRDPMSWFEPRRHALRRTESPEDAVRAIADMLRFRRPRATRCSWSSTRSRSSSSATRTGIDRLRAFATALGAELRGKAWLVALGQQKLDEDADDSFLVWAKDRFPR